MKKQITKQHSFVSRRFREDSNTTAKDIKDSFVFELDREYMVEGEDFDVEVDLDDSIAVIYVFSKSHVTDHLLKKYYNDDFNGFTKGWTNSAPIILSVVSYNEDDSQENTLIFRTTV